MPRASDVPDPSMACFMPVSRRLPAVFVDADDTLVRSFGSKRIAITSMVERVRALHTEGSELYCWSSGGREYAHSSARELGLEHCFRGFLPKPNVLIDDAEVDAWPDFTQVHPNVASTEDLDAMRRRLDWR